MPGLFVDPRTGEKYDYEGADPEAAAQEQATHGLVTAEQYEKDQAYEKQSLLEKAGGSGTAFAQAYVGLGSEAANALGINDDTESIREAMSTPESQENRERHPIAFGAGAAVPSALVGGLLGMAGAGLGTAAAAQGVESALSGLSQESLDAVTQKRDFSAKAALWNGVLDFGLGAVGYGLSRAAGYGLSGGFKPVAEEAASTADSVASGKRNWLSEVDPGEVPTAPHAMSAGAAANDFDDDVWDEAIKSVDDANAGKGAVPEARFLAQEAEPLTDLAAAQIADNLDLARSIVKKDISEAVRVGDIERIAAGSGEEVAEQVATETGPKAALREFPARERVSLADVRKKLGDMPREEQDQLLKQMQRDEELVLYRNDNPRSLTQADHDAVMTVGDSPRHIVYFTPKAESALPRPGKVRTGGWSDEMKLAQDEWVGVHPVEQGRAVVDAIRDAKKASSIGEGFDAGGFGARAIKEIDSGVAQVMASQGAKRFNALNNLKRGVDSIIRDVGNARTLNGGDAGELIGVLRPYTDGIREGLERPDLWGRAAPLQADVNAGWHAVIEPLSRMENRLSERLGRTWGEVGQAAVNRRTKASAVGQALRAKAVDNREFVQDVGEALDGIERLAEARQSHGLSRLEGLDTLRKALSEVKQDFNMGSVLAVAKRKAGEAGGGLGAAALDAGIGAVAGKIPLVGGLAGKGARAVANRLLNSAERPAANSALGKVLEARLQAWSKNPDLANAGFSRSLPQWLQGSLRGKGGQVAGVAALAGGAAALHSGQAGAAELPSSTPEQQAQRAQIEQQLATMSPEDQAVQVRTMDGLARIGARTQSRVDDAVRSLFAVALDPKQPVKRSPEVVALDRRAERLGVTRPVARFMGRKTDDLFEAFEQKKALLNSIMLKPGQLAANMAENLGDLHRLQPEIFAKMVGKTAQTAAYLHNMMPGNAGRSMLNPDGYPPTAVEIEEWAGHWDGALHPIDAVEDLAVNDLQPEQIDAVKANHPEAFEMFQTTALKHIGVLAARGKSIPQQALEQIDSALDLDGAGDQTLSWQMAGIIQQATAVSTKQEAPSTLPPAKMSKYPSQIGSESLATLNPEAP